MGDEVVTRSSMIRFDTFDVEPRMSLLESPTDGAGTPEPPKGPFAVAAMRLRDLGLAVMPVGGDDGKRPLVNGYAGWRRPPAVAAINKWQQRFGHCNIGISCGPSKIAVVDIDAPELHDRVLAALGDTPLVIQTPSGGFHFYYRDECGLANMNLRNIGLAIDIKAKGGFVVAPPSVNPKRGRSYAIMRGDWSLCAELPSIDVAAISRLTGQCHGQGTSTESVRPAGLIPKGHRNHFLFEHLRLVGPFASLEAAIDEARFYNNTQNETPEDEANVLATARGVWSYQQSGKLRKPNTGYIRIAHSEMDALGAAGGKNYPVGLALLAELRRSHGGPELSRRPFAVTAEAMTESKVIPGVQDPKRISRARLTLERAGLLRLVVPARRVAENLRKPALYLLGRMNAPVSKPIAFPDSDASVPEPRDHEK